MRELQENPFTRRKPMEAKESTRVVAAIELDDSARIILGTAAKLAGPEGKITLLHLAAGTVQVRRNAESAVNAMNFDEQRIRDFLARELGGPSDPTWGKIDVHIGAGDAAEQILQLAVDEEADFIVVGTHERAGLERLALGSVSADVSRRAHCSVVIARYPDYEGREKTATIEAPLAPGQAPMIRASAPARQQTRRFSFYNANLIPTGIPRGEVR
jgi:nucleotide-binding universal stress UspA family protein